LWFGVFGRCAGARCVSCESLLMATSSNSTIVRPSQLVTLPAQPQTDSARQITRLGRIYAYPPCLVQYKYAPFFLSLTNYMYYHRAPSRLLWFIIGAGAATWWIKRKDCEKRSFGPCRRLPPSSQGFPNASNPAPPYPYSAPAPPAPSEPSIPSDQPPVAPQQSAAPPAPRMRFPLWEWEMQQDREWEQDKENFIKMSNQAADVVRTLFLYPISS